MRKKEKEEEKGVRREVIASGSLSFRSLSALSSVGRKREKISHVGLLFLLLLRLCKRRDNQGNGGERTD